MTCVFYHLELTHNSTLSALTGKYTKRQVTTMTEQQKEQAVKLREQGNGYKKIAKALGVNVGSVSIYFKRLREKANATYCLSCKRKLKQTKGHRQKKFCSENCRRYYWKCHRISENQKAFYTQTCKQCGIEFTVYGNPNRKYCCWECYQKSRVNGKEKRNE